MSYRVTNAYNEDTCLRAGAAGEDGEKASFATLDAATHEAKLISKGIIGRFVVRSGGGLDGASRIRAIALDGKASFADKCTVCKGTGKVADKSTGGWTGPPSITCSRCIGLGVFEGMSA